jgi:SAM-dependent methyltransferase
MADAPEIEPKAFHEFEHAGWQRASSAYHHHFISLTSQAIGPLLNAVGAPPSTAKSKLLDIASGPGYVAAEAARRGWSVVGIDFSEAMVALARSIHPHIDFRHGDAEALSFANGEFNAVVMNFGILHLARPEDALKEACRVLCSGGHFAFSAWATPDKTLGFRVVLDSVAEFGDPNVQLPVGPPFFRFSDPEECRCALEAVGFADVHVEPVALIWRLDSAADFFEAFIKGSARTGGLLNAQTPSALGQIRAAIEQRITSFERNGKLEIPMPALVASACKP